MLGPYVNGVSVVLGSVFGGALGDRMSANLRNRMPHVFGCCSMALGVAMIVKVQALPPVVLALVLGAIIGELVHLERHIRGLAGRLRRLVEKFTPPPKGGLSHEDFLERFVALMVLFCASGTSVFGSMNEGITGDATLLLVKAVLDLFTSAIFAASLGYAVAALAIPQLAIQAALYGASTLLMPLTTPAMVADFSACGGVIMLATGFRICEIKSMAVANWLPALFIVMPLSALWARVMPH